MKEKNTYTKLIVILLGIALTSIIIIGVCIFQKSEKNRLLHRYVEECSESYIEGKQFCECSAYHLKYILGEKEAYRYFDMYINNNPETEAFAQTKDIVGSLLKYCRNKISLVDSFYLSTENQIINTGDSFNKAFCRSYQALEALGKERYVGFIKESEKINPQMTPSEYMRLNSLYNLDKILSKWQTCSDKFSINDIKTDNQDVKEVIEKLRAYYSEKSEQQDENRIQQINFDN